jgi:4-amino-4-deoxy-L-arabinose transferase-like glycosyltransferase
MYFFRTHKRYLILLSVLLMLKALWACYEISNGYISLNPDEAQYWTWSQNLDFGFYSKPPGIAWQIWLGCKIFGQNELGVRFFSVVFSMVTSFAIYLLAFCMGGTGRLAFWSAIILAFSPIGLMGTFAATTDVGFILFWTLALCPLVWALYKESTPNYYLVGAFILLGSLFKWPIYLLWPIILLAGVVYRPFYHRTLWYGFAISLLGLLPSIIWNSTHEWATFRHVFTQSARGSTSKPNFWDFFGAQFGVLSPIFFILFLLSLIEVLKRKWRNQRPLLFCAFVSAFILCSFLAMSLVKKIQANWAIYAYPSATILIAWYALDALAKGDRWLRRGLLLSVFMVSLSISIPFLQKNNYLSQRILPYRINPFRHSLGWSHLQKELRNIPYDPEQNFFFSDSYQLSSLLSFYGPVQKRQYFLNVSHKRKNQFSFWPSMAKEKLGKTGYYIWADNSKDFIADVEYRKNKAITLLNPYFEEVEFVKIIPLFSSHNVLVKGALLFKCKNYNGKEPREVIEY